MPNRKNIDLTPIDIWIKAETTMSQNKDTVGINELQTKFQKSIRELSRTAYKVSEGDLSVRANVNTRDEVGHLAAVFNKMVQRIDGWYQDFEDQVKPERNSFLSIPLRY